MVPDTRPRKEVWEGGARVNPTSYVASILGEVPDLEPTSFQCTPDREPRTFTVGSQRERLGSLVRGVSTTDSVDRAPRGSTRPEVGWVSTTTSVRREGS